MPSHGIQFCSEASTIGEEERAAYPLATGVLRRQMPCLNNEVSVGASLALERLKKISRVFTGDQTVRIKQGGFSLIELMIAVAIIAILTAIALPSYQQHVIKSNRVAAQAAMMVIANFQQQLLLSNRAYVAAADADAFQASTGYVLPTEVSAKYDFSITVGVGAVPSFLITFVPQDTQASDGNLTLTSEGVKGPSDKW
jgi:type IV pilus assembly protein PilE